MRKLLLLTMISVFLSSCGGPKVFYDYDQNIDFNNFQSFSFYKDMQSGLRPLDQERVQEAIREQLKEQDFATSETPDFKVNFYADFYNERSNSTIGIGVGGGGGRVGGGVSGGIPIGGTKTFISLTVEFVQASNNELYWQAVIESPFNNNTKPEERIAFFNAIIEKALQSYPPEEK
ncbi:DUF4136 domain-containing protein [Haloflavibacter putidus]|uniref:DUF4136 domain-containing protein n=1 Tax=Haloflavibacter putidus TaxID=2576776 RepID=A0A507ZM73_9FLAO|nr:DUF4136 domain-containing protein [Haloflavibacter putidus]TQD34812.1 DUF4136 domain-containing protein [Haloflavibacter putidus]